VPGEHRAHAGDDKKANCKSEHDSEEDEISLAKKLIKSGEKSEFKNDHQPVCLFFFFNFCC
jgi:hypothetical protein